jgi:hypothetical protein
LTLSHLISASADAARAMPMQLSRVKIIRVFIVAKIVKITIPIGNIQQKNSVNVALSMIMIKFAFKIS